MTHRARTMSMTPIEPRECGGLKGFGFTINFEDPRPIPSPEADKAASAPPPAGAAANHGDDGGEA
jgi:hypothetical protein